MVRGWFKRLRSLTPVGRTSSEESAQSENCRLPFTEVESALALYVKALSGSKLRLMSSAQARQGSFCDGKTVFVPPEIDMFRTEAEARRLYRVMSAWKVVQARSGAIDVETVPDPLVDLDRFILYDLVSGEWVDRTMVDQWPGLSAELKVLREDALDRRLQRNGNGSRNGAGQSIEALMQGLLALPLDRLPREDDIRQVGETVPSADAIVLDMLRAVGDVLHNESDGTRELVKLSDEFARQQNGTALHGKGSDHIPPAIHYRGRIRHDLLAPEIPEVEVSDAKPQRPGWGNNRAPRRNEPLLIEGHNPLIQRNRKGQRGGSQSVQLSLGDREPPRMYAQVPLTEAEKQGAHLYHEWSVQRNSLQPEWCAVRERRPRSGNTDRVEKILRQDAALVRHLKQQFEALRPERLRLNRQLDGDELDLSALVEAHADRKAGRSISDKLYSRVLEKERNIAMTCLVDLSGSTGAWIDDDPRNEQVIEVTRRAIVFLCEALSVLDDRHSVLGFTGSTRKHCELSVLKGFDETYGETVKGRIGGIAPGAYTRMGAAIRHASTMLAWQPARVKILLLFTDGRPNDFDGYGGMYGIEDTRRALIEARQMGVSTFALTIDAEARDYMPYMFGLRQYLVIEDTPALALRLSEVYRRLTVQ